MDRGSDSGDAMNMDGVGSRSIDPSPRIYIASPLTNLSDRDKRQLHSEVSHVKMAIEAVTIADRSEGDTWPVALSVPFESSAPWNKSDLSPEQVYERNLTEVVTSDALIVLADRAASAGVGQEIEWAARIGIPILYLCSADAVSRQIQGMPVPVTCVAYGGNADTLRAHLTNFLSRWRPQIQDGPRRRASRRLRFEALTSTLRSRWEVERDPTGLASRCGLHPNFVTMMLADPLRVALLSSDALMMLCAELRVPLTTFPSQLSVPETRALVLASIEDGWDDTSVERLRLHGVAAVAADPEKDLKTMDAWRKLRRDRGVE